MSPGWRGGGHQRHFRAVDRRKPVLRRQHAVIGLIAISDRMDRPMPAATARLNAGEVGGGVGHVPGAAGAFERVDRALRDTRQPAGKPISGTEPRARIDRGCALLVTQCTTLRPHRDAAFFASARA